MVSTHPTPTWHVKVRETDERSKTAAVHDGKEQYQVFVSTISITLSIAAVVSIAIRSLLPHPVFKNQKKKKKKKKKGRKRPAGKNLQDLASGERLEM